MKTNAGYFCKKLHRIVYKRHDKVPVCGRTIYNHTMRVNNNLERKKNHYNY